MILIFLNKMLKLAPIILPVLLSFHALNGMFPNLKTVQQLSLAFFLEFAMFPQPFIKLWENLQQMISILKKLENYQIGGNFNATQFFFDIEDILNTQWQDSPWNKS